MRTGTLEGGEGEGDGRRCCSMGVVVEEETAVGVWKVKRQSRVCTACWMLGVSMEVPNWASSLLNILNEAAEDLLWCRWLRTISGLLSGGLDIRWGDSKHRQTSTREILPAST